MLALNRLLATGDVIEGMAVVAATTPNMTVIVSAGSARISTGSYPSSYGYFVGIDTTAGTPAGEVVTITTANGSNPRIDTIVAYVDVSVTASSGTPNNPNNMLKLAAVAGTPNASPSAPSGGTIQSAVGASNPYVILANVLVGTSVTSISNGNITDKRTFVALTPNNLTSGTGTSWPWQSWTPTIANLTIGNGTVVGKYQQTGKRVEFELLVTLGSTSSVGTSPTFTVPVTVNSRYNTGAAAAFLNLGSSSMFDSSTATIYAGHVAFLTSDITKFQAVPLRGDLGAWIASQNTIAATQPLPSWATGDIIWLKGNYEAA